MMSDRPEPCVVVNCGRDGQHLPDCEDTTTCPGCLPRTAEDGLLTCRYHYDKAVDALGVLPDLDADMQIALHPYRSPQAPKAEGSPTFDAPDAIRSNVTAMRQTLHMQLSNMVAVTAMEQGIHHPANNVEAFVEFLLRHAEWLSNHRQYAPTWGHTIQLLATNARRAAYPARQAGNYLGPCPQTMAHNGEQVLCGAPIRFDQQRYVEDDTYQPTCPRCGYEDTLAGWTAKIVGRIDAAPDRQLTATPLSMWLSWGLRRRITASAVRGWKARGDLAEVGRNDKNQPLYDRAEAEAYARKLYRLKEAS